MTQYNTILFDLDGTISDSAPGIVNSVLYALDKLGLPAGDRNDLKKFVGPPLYESFRKYYKLSDSETENAVKYFREYYQRSGIMENDMYPGIPELLEALRGMNKTLIVATSKPEPFAIQILERYGIASYFTYIAGSSLDETRTKKDEVIAYALETNHITDKSQTVMIGDRSHDIMGAKKNDLPCIGVLYGYGDRPELENAGVTHIVETVDDLKSFFTGL
ncbi:MAG: HAD family hydrolase [Oscillospiraceae bacterium]